MSDLEKTSLKNRLAQSGQNIAGLPPLPSVAQVGGSCCSQGLKKDKKIDYTPRHWSEYFSKKSDVELDNKDVFCVYERGTAGPVLIFLHGGGYSALSFALCSVEITEKVDCQCVAIDMRSHGDTMTSNDADMSVNTLATDVIEVVNKMFGEACPPMILVGHSMGGSVAVHAANLDRLPMLRGLVVIDVVEGTALESLSNMQSFLSSRPLTFSTLKTAIEWSLHNGQIKNVKSAQVSVPGHLRRILNSEVPSLKTIFGKSMTPSLISVGEVLFEEEEDEDNDTCESGHQINYREFWTSELPNRSSSLFTNVEGGTRYHAASSGIEPGQTYEESDKYVYTWRIDLSRTEKYWTGWFQGLTKLFLSVPVPKLLLLAGMDRLDKELTISQMQGKFQLHNLPRSGHAVHEDAPDKVAEVIATFLVRNKLSKPNTNFDMAMPAC